ncbi:hypothetical protein Pla163_02230 [Planctomycetes bacterium Pla163]|uniref:Uncharacterized protein n=1 Tax=Rohdeia mirabilis TaxID=2528008 RepID=A0A518CV76_9BACT|nr:hypothetical protein Pla163_02230 [Planctomycetes bacterium Pla163]
MRETDLYDPIKRYLEGQGYEVKAEVQGCDVVAQRADEPPVIVELKLAMNLDLVLQGIDRQKVSDAVYVAVPDDRASTGRTLLRRAQKDVVRLCKLLGLGLIVVRFRARSVVVDVLVDPAPYVARKSPKKQRRLLAEFEAMRGDHNVGGSRGARVTGYRQDALACALHLREHGPGRPAQVRDAAGVSRAQRILYDNHYGWFERLGPGRYGVTDAGGQALEEYKAVVEALRVG